MTSPSLPSTTKSNISPDDQAKINEVLAIDKWEEIGFHRSLGSFWYQFSIILGTAILSILFLTFIVSWLFPYPEMSGYNKVASGFFLVVYQIFDLGTAFGIERFIAEWRIKNPKKMLQYIQFFIWYQMWTGLIQVLVISIIIFRVIRYSELSYLTWMFLIICQKQWPGMLGTFKNVLIGLQHYDKANILEFFSSEVLRQIMSIGFILMGRAWGRANPVYGDLIGATLGLAIGGYVAEIIMMLVSVKYFNHAMKPFGIRFRDAWGTNIDKSIVKECIWFGFQVSIVPIINTATGTWMLVMYVNMIPQYTTYIIIAEVAAGVAAVVNVGDFKLTPAIAEAYMNKKVELTKFYIANSIKWNGFFMALLLCIIIGFIPMILESLTELPELANYSLAVAFLPFVISQNLFRLFIDIPNPILVGTMHIGFYTFVRLLEEFFQVFFVWIFLYVFRLQELPWGIYMILGWEHFFPRLIKMGLCFIFINRKIFKLKIYWIPSFIIPLLSAVPILIIALIWQHWIFFLLIEMIGVIFSVIITLIFAILILPLLIFLPLTGILGGWDDQQLCIFKKSVKLSGPSKFIVQPFYKIVCFWAKKSKFHNHFKIPWENAEREIVELHLLKAHMEYVKPEKVDLNTQAIWLKEKLKEKLGNKFMKNDKLRDN